ncbi:VCBS repeat-containing protein [Christiangramia salexigens]|uniref:ASPIC/UnbV domain-containing protein n=1 Tax=Christiangramia salexigens TaxID=1913577 RepID=A0A1L3J3R4_9FLAO|nr:VCBS repeat-containing protein [Christiangramia salexigens]APG59756.1 hypothetical protein LPB144_04705 [Christiangramia salexigens]
MIRKRLGVLVCSVVAVAFLSCKKDSFLFEKVSPEDSNIHFSNRIEAASELNIFNYLYYYNGAGVAAGDYNQDGLIDLYFTSNESADKLYLNKGNFKFEECTQNCGIDNAAGWTTGVSNVDINGDGLLDLYISKVSGFQELKGHNLLYINTGNNSKGEPVFKESAEEYGLDFSGFSTQSVFLDYDLDGDLDMFLLNHSVYPNRNYGRGDKRKGFDLKSGDRLFKNENGKYRDVSGESGIFQGIIGYGLGIAVGDLNDDHYPDIYVGNDFFENDYLYINQRDDTFKEIISEHPEKLGHTSHFSMGNEITDVNNDGLADIFSLDMLPEDLETYKTSGLEYPYQTYSQYLKNGFSPQYMQNTLHINKGELNFSETAFLSGVAASEWSWGALFADLDNDTHKDLIISNGIKGATNDMDFIKYISNEKIQKELSTGKTDNYNELIRELPEKKVPNFVFQNKGDNTFSKKNDLWIDFRPGFSHGLVYADLDNDGDLDLVINNMDEKAGVYRNKSTELNQSRYLNINLKGASGNSLGIGAKVKVFSDGKLQVQEHYLSRGYLSSVAPGLHFGTGITKNIDSVQVIWNKDLSETRYKIKTNSTITFNINDADSLRSNLKDPKQKPLLVKKNSLINYYHTEQSSLEFNRDPLIPFAYSNQSPRVAAGDFNGDGLEDLLLGGGKTQPTQIWLQSAEGSFIHKKIDEFEKSSISEDTDQVFLDADSDGDLDILVVSGGNEFRRGKPLQPRLYLNNNGELKLMESEFKGVEINASRVSVVDLNNDGFLDVSFTANVVPGAYGKTPKQYLFLNNGKGNFEDVSLEYSEVFTNAGNVQDIIWVDLNEDSYKDAIVVGHWMPVSIYLNDGKKLTLLDTDLEDTSGWWNSLEAADFDKDGDIDIVAGNWGLNSRLTASRDNPLKLYLNDFDGNSSVDPIVTYYYKGEETPFSSKDELDQQLPFLKKKFPTYKQFAAAKFEDLFSREKITDSQVKEVYELGSYYFENRGDNSFIKHRLPFEVQASSISEIEKYDFNADGFLDLYFVGNNYEISTQLGRLDANHGVLLLNDKKGFFKPVLKNLPELSGAARDIQKVIIKGETHFVITFNNASAIILKSNNSL